MLKRTIILIILTFALTSLTSNQNEPEKDFQISVDNFIKKYSADFSVLSADGNDFILDNKINSTWHKKVTLKSKKSFINHYKQTVYQRLHLGFYLYDTDKQCANALDSLLFYKFGCECSCDKIEWGDKGKGLKTTPFIYLINERTIITCWIACEHENNFWTTFKYDLIKTFGRKNSGIVEVGCGGTVNFRKL